MFFDAAIRRSETTLRPQYWRVLLKSTQILMLYGLAVNEISVVLKKSGTDIRICREEWQEWLGGAWRERCRPGLESEAIAEAVPELCKVALPQPGDPPRGGLAELHASLMERRRAKRR